MQSISKADQLSRWCAPNGKQAIYTTSDRAPQDFERCGELETVVRCDALGNRFIGQRSANLPEVFKGCGEDSRIAINNQKLDLKSYYAASIDTLKKRRGDQEEKKQSFVERSIAAISGFFEAKRATFENAAESKISGLLDQFKFDNL